MAYPNVKHAFLRTGSKMTISDALQYAEQNAGERLSITISCLHGSFRIHMETLDIQPKVKTETEITEYLLQNSSIDITKAVIKDMALIIRKKRGNLL